MKRRRPECVVEWLEGVDLDTCNHKKLKLLAKKAGIAANQSGTALVSALKQHAVDPRSSGARSVAKQEADAAKRRAAAAAAALEVHLPPPLSVSQDGAVPLQFPSSAPCLEMCPGEYCIVATESSCSKMKSVSVRLVALSDGAADGITCATLQHKEPRRRRELGNVFGKSTESWTLRALEPGVCGLVKSKYTHDKFWRVEVKEREVPLSGYDTE